MGSPLEILLLCTFEKCNTVTHCVAGAMFVTDDAETRRTPCLRSRHNGSCRSAGKKGEIFFFALRAARGSVGRHGCVSKRNSTTCGSAAVLQYVRHRPPPPGVWGRVGGRRWPVGDLHAETRWSTPDPAEGRWGPAPTVWGLTCALVAGSPTTYSTALRLTHTILIRIPRIPNGLRRGRIRIPPSGARW